MSLVTNEVLQALLTILKGKFDDKVDKVSGKGCQRTTYHRGEDQAGRDCRRSYEGSR